MAFLCPVRIRRGRHKNGSTPDGDKMSSRAPSIGRITGSASIETLVRVGIEKEHGLSPDSKMVVLHDFTPCVDDELEVKRGQTVNVLYQENDWVYVIAESGHEGFIPHSYCTPLGSQLASGLKAKKMPRDNSSSSSQQQQQLILLNNNIDQDQSSSRGTTVSLDDSGGLQSDSESYNDGRVATSPGRVDLNKHLSSSQSSLPDVHPFFKDPAGRYVVLYTFVARDENDVTVERGEVVTVLNREDPDWFWIVRSDGQEGFIPSAFVYPDEDGGQPSASHLLLHHHQSDKGNGPPDELRFHGSELVMLYDYKAQAPDDLSVRRGDWVYADLNNQTVDGWLWAYAPKSRKYGFLPKAYARPPAMTSL